MLRVLFDFVVDTWSNPLGSRHFRLPPFAKNAKERGTRHPGHPRLVFPCVDALRRKQYVGWLVSNYLLLFPAVTLALVRCKH